LLIALARRYDATLVSRAALGLSWLALRPGAGLAERVAAARSALAPRAAPVLDGADRAPGAVATVEPGLLRLMQRVKTRFDPAGVLRPGALVEGL
jgi:glycolate oxidase FAD binding subunit